MLSCCSHVRLCNAMGCNPPGSGSSVHGILQAWVLEWVAIRFFKGSSWPRDGTHVSCCCCIGRRLFFFTTEPPGKPGSHIGYWGCLTLFLCIALAFFVIEPSTWAESSLLYFFPFLMNPIFVSWPPWRLFFFTDSSDRHFYKQISCISQ